MLCVFVFAEPNHNHNKQDIHKVSEKQPSLELIAVW